MAAGSTEDTIVAYNSAQPWSPAHGVVNGSFVRMTFGSVELRGKLLPTGYIIWENGSRWLKERSANSKTTARLAKPSSSAPNPRPATGAAKGGPPADDESYSYSCAACPVPAVLVRTKRPRTPTRAFICAADDYEASYDETTSTGGDESYSYESYESCAPLRLELRSPRDQLRTPRTYIKIGQRKPHTRTALISLGASQPCPASHSAHVARACSRHASCPHPASVWCTAQTRRRTHRPRPSR